MSHTNANVESQQNTARFFTEQRHISWVVLLAVIAWGFWGYASMPKRKDPDVPVRVAVALTPWPGASAEKVEELVTRKIESRIAENSKIKKIESTSRTGLSVVNFELVEGLKETGKELDDIRLRLEDIRDLPSGAGPINFVKDFGDTAALMLTVASPKVDETELEIRATAIAKAIAGVRGESAEGRVTLVAALPSSIDSRAIARAVHAVSGLLVERGIAADVRPVSGSGFAALDFASSSSDAEILAAAQAIQEERQPSSQAHQDAWPLVLVRDPAETRERLAAVAGDKYSYRDLDEYTELLQRSLQTIPIVSKVTRSGVLEERVYLEYSQQRLAHYGIKGADIDQLLQARNIIMSGGVLEIGDRNLAIDTSGELTSEHEIGDVIVAKSDAGSPVYLRDLVDITRAYESPATYLNTFTWQDAEGRWQRSRAVTLSIQMRSGKQIAEFGEAVDAKLAEVRERLPRDLVVVRTSDQPLQVTENLDLFMKSLYEAIALVVLIALIGFWEWRSAALMALSIPITLAMTFGMMWIVGIDLQQVSIASLIIALGLLVDDPVVAGDAIKRELNEGKPRLLAAWVGPTKLATAILFATITNIVAYLPLLMISGDSGKFIYSLPVVLACSLVASRIASMTFVPLLGYYLLRPSKTVAPSRTEMRQGGFAGWYFRVGTWAIEHRWAVLVGSFVFLAAGGAIGTNIRQSFFPKDYAYLATIDVWLPEGSPLGATIKAARRSETVILEKAGHGELERLTTFVGGGAPRFWYSVSPELQQLNYAQIILQVKDKHHIHHLLPELQHALAAEVPGARIDVKPLEIGAPVGAPVGVRVSGEDETVLREVAEDLKAVLRSIPLAERVRDDWGAESFALRLAIDPDRANFAGVTNYDVASASAAAISGRMVTSIREGDTQIPVIARVRPEERARVSDVQNLYVGNSSDDRRIPLGQLSKLTYGLETEKIRRRNQFRTITVSAFVREGRLASEVMNEARERIEAIAAALPPGYRLEIGGEEEEQVKSFAEMKVVMAVSIACIYMALVLQFRNAVKPLLVFAAVPYGLVGVVIALVVMDAPFGFMAFLGVVSLIGVIVSHIIVLFDFIEEMRAEGESLEVALLDAGIVRLRPVLITVGATVLGLFPLASHGGPLWEPLCYVQIGGLTLASIVTLLMVPVIYATCVLDLRILDWPGVGDAPAAPEHVPHALSEVA